MKKSLSFCVFFWLVVSGLGQADSNILLRKGYLSRGTVQYQGHRFACDVIEYPATPSVVEASIKETMELRGYKATEKKGFIIYRNVILPNAGLNHPVDVFAQIEAKGRAARDKTLVHLLLTRPNEIPEKKTSDKTIPNVTAVTLAGSTLFLSDLEKSVSLQAHDAEVLAAEKELSKLQQEIRQMEIEKADMQKRLEKLQGYMARNDSNLANAQLRLMAEQARISSLKAKKL